MAQQQFTIFILMGNDAFQPDPAPELARLLREVTSLVEDGWQGGPCLDVNGNRVGSWALQASRRAETPKSGLKRIK